MYICSCGYKRKCYYNATVVRMRKHIKRNVCSVIYNENANNQSYLSMYKHMQHTDVNTGGYTTVQTGFSTYIYFCSAYIVIENLIF